MAETETKTPPAAVSANPFAGPIVVIFLFFVVFIILTLFYEVFLYRKYLDIYKDQSIYLLAFETRQAALRSGNDREKLAAYNAIADQLRRDSSVEEVWITDKDLRLLYSSNPRMMKDFGFQKLEASYFPLYKDGFTLKPDGFRPVVRHDMNRFSVYSVLAVKVKPDSFYDYTVGLKLRKFNFLFNRNDVDFGPGLRANLSIAVVWTLMILIAAVFTLLIVTLFVPSYTKLRELIARLNSNPDEALPPVPAMLAPVVDEVRAGFGRVREAAARSAIDAASGGVLTRDREIRKSVVDALFSASGEGLKGLDRAWLFSSPAAKAANLLQIRQTGPFHEAFSVVQPVEEKIESFIVAATYAVSMFGSITRDFQPRQLLSNMNTAFRTSYLSPANTVIGQFDISANVLSLTSAGFNTFLFHNRKIDEFMVFPASGQAVGRISGDEFAIGLKEEKLRVSPGDSVLFFNQNVLSKVGLDQLRTLMKDNAGQSASDILETIKKQFTDPGREDIFLFMIRKL